MATVSPIRAASPAKSPPTSSARRSASANRSRTEASAIAQPSAELPAKSCSMASVVGSPPSVPSTAPWSAATSLLPTDRSARCSSRSGFTPGLSRRNSFMIVRSPNTTDVLDCSAPITRPSPGGASVAPASGTNRTAPIVRPARTASSSQAEAVWSHRAS